MDIKVSIEIDGMRVSADIVHRVPVYGTDVNGKGLVDHRHRGVMERVKFEMDRILDEADPVIRRNINL